MRIDEASVNISSEASIAALAASLLASNDTGGGRTANLVHAQEPSHEQRAVWLANLLAAVCATSDPAAASSIANVASELVEESLLPVLAQLSPPAMLRAHVALVEALGRLGMAGAQALAAALVNGPERVALVGMLFSLALSMRAASALHALASQVRHPPQPLPKATVLAEGTIIILYAQCIVLALRYVYPFLCYCRHGNRFLSVYCGADSSVPFLHFC